MHSAFQTILLIFKVLGDPEEAQDTKNEINGRWLYDKP
jgi:hypothetical protein